MRKANIDVRKALLDKGWTQADLADAMDIDPSSLSKMLFCELSENEQRKLIDFIKESGEVKDGEEQSI